MLQGHNGQGESGLRSGGLQGHILGILASWGLKHRAKEAGEVGRWKNYRVHKNAYPQTWGQQLVCTEEMSWASLGPMRPDNTKFTGSRRKEGAVPHPSLRARALT